MKRDKGRETEETKISSFLARRRLGVEINEMEC
jgi:hypothetical protein